MKEMYPRAIKLVQRGLADVETMVTATYDLDSVGDAFDLAIARSGLKVLMTPTEPVR
jgi:threonine dehydrogenase-like Zn-dependent dehydrogenase